MNVALILGGILILGVVEIALRLLCGFGKPPLYVPDPQIGYRLAPHQRTRRFGNLFAVNQYSMRGPAIATKPEIHTLRILLLGDSVANGGWWTDQARTLSARMQRQLISQLSGTFLAVEVLNAAANSWGPRHELAYLGKFGTFEARAILLLLNTDDLFATAPTSAVVGHDRDYPQHYPPLALIEAITYLRKRRRTLPEPAAVPPAGSDRVGANLAAIQQIQHIAQQADSRLIVALTPLLRETTPAGPRDYEWRARDQLRQALAIAQVNYIDFLPVFQQLPNPQALYRDHIHLSPRGYALVSDVLCQATQAALTGSPPSPPNLPDSLLEDPWL